MAAIGQDVQFYIGETVTLRVTLKDNEGVVVNPTGYLIYYKLKGNETITKNSTSGITIYDAEAGKFDVVLSVVDTLKLDPGTYTHEIRVKDPSGRVDTVTRGNVTVDASLMPEV